ncbi:Putative proteasome component (PCI) domain, winged helix-like DNA-binding domain superfamily [Colletotrichum destructivum]|uniref:Protein CSN12 homolog n=1 Tax=Colletotrichum destructivum TaxID=34406 RepID=A0AAX4IVU3_9PEZI|nr:Putative proteasome component (PCI) domain, winged helix-like DNA-binding domain superfamily [Colletotrichum destructivum]
MEGLFEEFRNAYKARSGYSLAQTLQPFSPVNKPDKLRSIYLSTNIQEAKADVKYMLLGRGSGSKKLKLDHEETNGWVEVYTAYWKAIGEILKVEGDSSAGGRSSSWTKVYEAWKELTTALIRGYTNYGFEAWTIPCLYTAGKHLRLFAISSDEERNTTDAAANAMELGDDFDPDLEKQKQLRDCEQQLKRIFTLCLSDRAPLEDSRKWAIYFVINLLFKTYFKLNSASLSRTILKALSTNRGDMPPLEAFPKSQRVTFKFYEGVLFFLEENYVEAEKHLTEAWSLCHKDAKSNQERILTYLIPCHLLTTHTLPSSKLLEPFPRLQKLFLPLSRCIRKGDLRNFDLALQEGEEEFVRRRIYLTLERGRDIALRNLLRKVFIAGGFEEAKEAGAAPVRRTRVPVAEFAAAISLGSQESVDPDEVECLLANMIYKNLMKGYIARERGIVVLSKNGAFPGTGV